MGVVRGSVALGGKKRRRPRGARRQWRGKREMCWREERERMTMNMKRPPPSPSAEDHDDGDSNLVDIGYWLN